MVAYPHGQNWGSGRGARIGTMSSIPYLVPFYGLASAFLFALSNHFSNMGLQRSDARAGTLVSIATSAGAYWLLAPWFVKSSYWVTTAAVIFAIVGIIRPHSRRRSRSRASRRS